MKFSDGDVAAAAAAIARGEVVAYPTESFYALAVDALNEGALARLRILKGCEAEKVFSILVSGREMMASLCAEVPPVAERLMAQYWPGPLILLLPARRGLPASIVANGYVALRMSPHPLAQALVVATGRVITATSASPEGGVPPCAASDVAAYFSPSVCSILDGGVTSGGQPSTIVLVRGERVEILRKGAVDLTNFQVPEKIIQLYGSLDGFKRAAEKKGAEFEGVWNQNADQIGRVLRCHLAVEHYLTCCIEVSSPRLGSLNAARISFAQKLTLADRKDRVVADFLPGLKRLNQIRNRIAHSTATIVTTEDRDFFLSLPVFRAVYRLKEDFSLVGPRSDDPLTVLEQFSKLAALILNANSDRDTDFREAVRALTEKAQAKRSPGSSKTGVD